MVIHAVGPIVGSTWDVRSEVLIWCREEETTGRCSESAFSTFLPSLCNSTCKRSLSLPFRQASSATPSLSALSISSKRFSISLEAGSKLRKGTRLKNSKCALRTSTMKPSTASNKPLKIDLTALTQRRNPLTILLGYTAQRTINGWRIQRTRTSSPMKN